MFDMLLSKLNSKRNKLQIKHNNWDLVVFYSVDVLHMALCPVVFYWLIPDSSATAVV